MIRTSVIKTKIKELIQHLKYIFNSVSTSSELKLDAFIFSKQKEPQVRALIAGTGLYVTIPLNRMTDSNNFLLRFSPADSELINSVLNDTTDLCSKLIEGKKVQIVAKTFDRKTKKTALTVSIADYYNKNIEFEIDPTELSRNKFLLQLFNKTDAFNIGYSAAESRIRSEQSEIQEAKKLIQNAN